MLTTIAGKLQRRNTMTTQSNMLARPNSRTWDLQKKNLNFPLFLRNISSPNKVLGSLWQSSEKYDDDNLWKISNSGRIPPPPCDQNSWVGNADTQFEDKREEVTAVSYSNYLCYPGRIFRIEIWETWNKKLFCWNKCQSSPGKNHVMHGRHCDQYQIFLKLINCSTRNSLPTFSN